MTDFFVQYPDAFEAVLFAVSILAGTLGSLLGLGGGFILTPFLTLTLGIHIKYAIGASLISVIATSSGAAANYVKDRITNVRLALFLEIGTTLGAISGAFIAGWISPSLLYLLFSLLLVFSSVTTLRRKETAQSPENIPPDTWSDRLGLHSSYPDRTMGNVSYRVTRAKLGLFLMYLAGCVSALLGVGSGMLKVPAMDAAMRVPIKVSSATSNFMIGVTAATSAGIYFVQGNVLPGLAGPVALGVLVGSQIGSQLLKRWSSETIRIIFVLILGLAGIQMGVKGVQTLFFE